MTAREPRAVGVTVIQTEGNQGAIVIALDDQLAARMKADAFDHAVTGGLTAAFVLLAVFLAAGLGVRIWRRVERLTLDRRFKAAFRRMENRATDQALGVGGNP